MELKTKNGHSLFDISSLLQKSIRRGDEYYAGYAVNELRGWYNAYLWKRLLIISAEDCWGCMTTEIEALRQSDEFYNKGKKGYDRNGEFISKAVTLLLKARKNRDSDWFACNMIQSEETLNITEYLKLDDYQKKDDLPEYTFDCHTVRGKQMGKTKQDMIESEQAALFPYQEGDFDKRDWDTFHKSLKKIEQKNFNQPQNNSAPPEKDMSKIEDFPSELFK